MAAVPLALLFVFYLLSQLRESRNLIASTSQVSTQSIRTLYTDHIRVRSQDLVREMELKFQMMENELAIVARTAQHLIDTPELKGLGQHLRKYQHPYFSGDITYYSDLNYSTNTKGSHDTSINLNRLLHDSHGQLKPKVQYYIDLYSPMRLLLPMVQKYGMAKDWLYLVGPYDAAIDMATPWNDSVKEATKSFPKYINTNYWDISLKGLLKSWSQWIKHKNVKPLAPRNQSSTYETTWSPLYDDIFGQGKMITLYRPLWSDDRQAIEGAVGVDFQLKHILDLLTQDEYEDQSFAFLVRSDSSVLGVPPDKYPLLGLLDTSDIKVTQNSVFLKQSFLNQSTVLAIRQLSSHLSSDAPFSMQSFIGNDGKEYILSLGRVRSFNQFVSESQVIRPEFWSIGLLTTTDELVFLQKNLSNTIKSSFDNSLTLTLTTSAALFFATLLLTGYFSYRATRQIRFLNEGVEAIRNKKWNYQVDIVSNDELGSLGITFNQLTSQLKDSYEKLENYTRDLELKVSERTKNLEDSNRKLQEIAILDPLTQVHNRLYFDDFFDKSWRSQAREQQPLSVILIDVDKFKQYNDTYGHQKGDECLIRIATALNKALGRASECFARYGGEEFIVALQQNQQSATAVAKRLRKLVATLSIPHTASKKGIVSISLGVSTCVPSDQCSPAQLIHWADRALYKSKAQGRDRVCVANTNSTD